MNNYEHQLWYSGPQRKPQAELSEVDALKARIAELERRSTEEKLPLGYVKCHGCGKIVKDGRWLGTLHLCS